MPEYLSSRSALSVAPMIGWTDRNYRYLVRHLTRRTLLYSEMVMDNAIIHNTHKLDDFIGFDALVEPPLALQLGGRCPESLSKAVLIAEQYGNFTEINLNSGCPSNKAKKAGFGAELMLEPDLVREIVYNMKRVSTNAEISVKCRIGVTKRDSWDNLVEYVSACRDGGASKVIVHARCCVLSGLSPAQNRTIPPLQYDVVHRLVETFPEMHFVLNGGIHSFAEADAHLQCQSAVGGVMIGREAYNNPWVLANADRHYYGTSNPNYSRREVLERYLDYADNMRCAGHYKSSTPLLAKPLHNYFHGCDTNKYYKRKLDDLLKRHSHKEGKGELSELVYEAIDGTIPTSFLDERMSEEGVMC